MEDLSPNQKDMLRHGLASVSQALSNASLSS